MKRQISIVVFGRVQGVFFRASTKRKAQQLGLSGTVRNQTDGSVHIIAYGDKEKVDELINWCSKGPPMARIDSLDVSEDHNQIPSGFEITY